MASDIIILVVDDEREHADGVAESLEKFCSKAIAVYNGKDALEILDNEKIDIVVTDLNLGGDIDGISVLKQALNHNADAVVILVTAYATIDTCKEAIRQGAYDYLVKPIDIDQLRSTVEQARKKLLSSSKLNIGRHDFGFNGIIGKSTAMEGVIEIVRRISPTNISVLIEGHSGTGKELMARAIHDNSLRASMAFKPVNCAGLTETLLESELFGHVKGAFTGAENSRKGLFEIADKGTLFLDEIGDMPMNMQAKLLRVLEDGIVIPVGSHKQISVDVRLISATNHDMHELVENKKFREDLYFRIKGVSISLPSLTDRTEDLHELTDHFITEAAGQTGSGVKGVTGAAESILMNYSWPGNIRQLRNCIRTMVVMCDTDMLDVKDIPPEISQRPQLTEGSAGKSDLSGMALNDLERRAIIDTLAKTGNNREKAAKILGIGERTLYRKIKEYGL